VALVVFEVYGLYLQTKAVSFCAFLCVSGLSSPCFTTSSRCMPLFFIKL